MRINGVVSASLLTIWSLVLYYRISEPEGNFVFAGFGI